MWGIIYTILADGYNKMLKVNNKSIIIILKIYNTRIIESDVNLFILLYALCYMFYALCSIIYHLSNNCNSKYIAPTVRVYIDILKVLLIEIISNMSL